MKRYKKVIIILLVIIIIVIASFCFYYGFIINNASKPKNVFKSCINRIDDVLFEFLEVDKDYNLGDNFTVSGDIEYKLEGAYYLKNSVNKPDDIKIYNKINNLNNSKVTFKYIQDEENDKFYSEYNHLIGVEQILNKKTYVENATEYVYINTFLDKYVNNGNSVLFETVNATNTTEDNINYIHEFILESLNNNLKEEYFDKEKKTIKLDEEEKVSYQMSIRIDNDRYKEILNNIIKDIRKNDRANNIISSLYSDFPNYKVGNKRFLEKNESYIVNIYTDNIWYKPLKYEVIHLKDDTRDMYYYIGDLEGELTHIHNDELKYNTDVSIGKKRCLLQFSNKNGRSIGIIKLDKNIDMFNFDVDLLLDGKSYVIGFSSKIKDYKKNKNYTVNNLLNIRYSENNIVKFSGNIKNKIVFNNKSVIEEEIGDVVIRTTFTKEEENKFKNYKDEFNLRLER